MGAMVSICIVALTNAASARSEVTSETRLTLIPYERAEVFASARKYSRYIVPRDSWACPSRSYVQLQPQASRFRRRPEPRRHGDEQSDMHGGARTQFSEIRWKECIRIERTTGTSRQRRALRTLQDGGAHQYGMRGAVSDPDHDPSVSRAHHLRIAHTHLRAPGKVSKPRPVADSGHRCY
jgi:hypothetical protein